LKSKENIGIYFLFHHFSENEQQRSSLRCKKETMPINYNGVLYPDEQPIFTAGNRSFRYGDGLFESIRAFDGRLPFFHLHWQRLAAGMDCLKLERHRYFTPVFLENEIAKLTNGLGNWRIRLTVWRSGGGLYTPETNQPHFLIEATPLPSNRFELNETGLSIGIYNQSPLPIQPIQPIPPIQPIQPISNFKLTSSLPFVLAAQHKQALGLDDCLLLNTAGRLACATNANIFWVKNGKLYTPPLTEGCVAGTLRATVLSIAKSLKIKAVEKRLRLDALATADELCLTNAVQGIRWVRQMEGVEAKFENGLTNLLFEELNGRVC
jgi:branched-chain amino acid aminotransferase